MYNDKYVISKTFSLAMGHILDTAYTAKCCNLHGHTYTVEIELSSNTLNEDNVVMDYTFIKEAFNNVIDAVYDHTTLVPPKWHAKFKDIPGTRLVSFNPTAEAIAKFIYDTLKPHLTIDDVNFTAVVVRETDTSYACYRP